MQFFKFNISALYLIIVMLMVSCKDTSADGQGYAQGFTSSQSTYDKTEMKKNENPYWEKMIMYPVKDKNGMLQFEMPLPASWKSAAVYNPNEPVMTGPHGVAIRMYSGKAFAYYSDWQMQQIYAQNGQTMRALPTIEELINQDIKPWADQLGMRMVKYSEVSEVSQNKKWYDDQLYRIGNLQRYVVSYGIDFVKSDGTQLFLLCHINASGDSSYQLWSYACESIEADSDYYEMAKKQYIFSLANIRYAMEPIMAFNRNEIQKQGLSWAAFEQKMKANWSNFEANQRAHVNKSNAINDAIMQGYQSASAASDRMQGNRIDGIREETNVVNNTGDRYKVAAGYNQYWMNSDGEYISTNLNDYNPNQDENFNRQNWKQLREIRN